MFARSGGQEGLWFFYHFDHQNPLVFHTKLESRIGCKACVENVPGEVYGCLDCLFFLHCTIVLCRWNCRMRDDPCKACDECVKCFSLSLAGAELLFSAP
ncbi:hypothetical protein NL676_012810 [Syzygium grande]|nr:hypothetical protein NL676_012810 [Syzygium grande]